MVRDRKQGKIVFVSSVLGFMAFVGYSSYAPGKYALRGWFHVPVLSFMQTSHFRTGLAECLRSELILYGIDVHCFFPCTIFTPGHQEENKTKPKVTCKIEEVDSGLSPEQAAAGILKGGNCVRIIFLLMAGNRHAE
jgi:3-dehydrosphinganine reductase